MRNENSRSIEERVGTALADGDLRQKEGACDLDKIGALGMVGIRDRLADAVYRLKYANQRASYEDALLGVYGLARALDRRHRWRLRGWRLRVMSKSVLDYWLSDICRTCNGVRYEVVRGSPHLSDRACPTCKGAGKRAFPWLKRAPRVLEGKRRTHENVERWGRVVAEIEARTYRHKLLLSALEENERAIGERMIAKLANEVRSI